MKPGLGSHIEPKTFSKILNFPQSIALLDIPKMQLGQIVQNTDETELRLTNYVAMESSLGTNNGEESTDETTDGATNNNGNDSIE